MGNGSRNDRRQAYGTAMRQWREMRGISQEAMAQALGLRDAKSISRLEKGESPIPLELLEGWATEVGSGSVANLLTQPDRPHSAHIDPTNPYGTNTITNHEASAKEREQLLERIKHLEGEVLHLRRSEEFLREQLKRAQGS